MKEREERILLVSNRLPVTSAKVHGETVLTPSAGGLATALRSFSGAGGMLWFGWPGNVPVKERPLIEQRLIEEHQCIPVFMGPQLVERFYEGFSNSTIWPLFHSFPSIIKYNAEQWEAYKEANRLFCDRVIKELHPGDRVWIHDYQLMLLPLYLRERAPEVSIGFFLHIPFPPFEILRLLPPHRDIVQSLLSSDLIGFHTHDYAHAFLGSVRRLLGYENTLGQVTVGPRTVQADVFPLGVDYPSFQRAAKSPEIREEVKSTLRDMGGVKIIFSVSRLDYTKGLPESLAAVEALLTRHPEWKERVAFVLVVVPSREKVERYASLKKEIDEAIGKLNSTFGTLNWMPIRYIYRNMSFQELVALYASADVGFVAPLRDGMNLIAKEYVASRVDGRGVLVLSEMAGAAKELLEAVIVNPYGTEEVADALHAALTMPEDEQARRLAAMQAQLETYDVSWWVRTFLARLDQVKEQARQLAVKILDSEGLQELLRQYRSASKRQLIFDYDGTLVPFADTPDRARPDLPLLERLEQLGKEEKNQVVLLSSRDRKTMQAWFGQLDIMLVAEHGAWMRPRGEKEWKVTVEESQEFWKLKIRPMLELYVHRIPGSFIEEKDFSLVWHYRRPDAESGWAAAKELLDTLTNVAANLRIQVLPTARAIEVKTMEISKGLFYTRFLGTTEPHFILAVGDDWKDEDLFAVLPASAYSIRVGIVASNARFNVHSLNEIRNLINLIEGRTNVHAG